MTFDVSGRIALVTGSSRGIGHALARGLLDAGATVVLNGRDPAALQRARGELVELTGCKAAAEAFDVTDPAAVAAGVARIEEQVGPIDILVDNTGVQHRAPLTEFADDGWRRLVDTNLGSAFYTGREVARRMIPRGHGKIVNICSVQSEVSHDRVEVGKIALRRAITPTST